ncbi:hypothetical protein [Dickeya oryzae]
MEIQDFVGLYKNHPVLFIGTGFSLRYLKESFSWDGLLMKIANEINENPEFYYDLKADSLYEDEYKYDVLAGRLEEIFNNKFALAPSVRIVVTPIKNTNDKMGTERETYFTRT